MNNILQQVVKKIVKQVQLGGNCVQVPSSGGNENSGKIIDLSEFSKMIYIYTAPEGEEIETMVMEFPAENPKGDKTIYHELLVDDVGENYNFSIYVEKDKPLLKWQMLSGN